MDEICKNILMADTKFSMSTVTCAVGVWRMGSICRSCETRFIVENRTQRGSIQRLVQHREQRNTVFTETWTRFKCTSGIKQAIAGRLEPCQKTVFF